MSSAYKLEKLLEGKGNRYCLTVVASRRARELNAGTPALIESEVRKTTSLALEEVLKGKIKYEIRASKLPPEAKEKKVSSKEKKVSSKEKKVSSKEKKKKNGKESIPKGALREK